MKRHLFLIVAALLTLTAQAQFTDLSDLEGQSCTTIMVGKRASADGSVMTSHTCDGRYRTWMTIEPAKNHPQGTLHEVRHNTMNTTHSADTVGVKVVGTLPEVAHTYAYLNTAYPCLNEKQLAIGEATFGGPDVLQNKKGWFTIEELERIVLQRCDNARDAIRLIGQLVKQYGYGDVGECLTIADRSEVWEFEIVGEGPDKVGACWVAQRIPDDHVGVNCNIPRIGKLQYNNPDYFMHSGNCEKVARKLKLWDGKEEFVFWKAFNPSYANGKNFREREYFILSTLAPSLGLSMDMAELPFSVKPEQQVSARQVMALLRSTFEGTELDMCRNLKQVVKGDTVASTVANPWMTNATLSTYNMLRADAVTFRRTVSVAWCSYSFVVQLRSWLPDAVGGVCWMAVDNPGQSPRIPIFCGTTRLPKAFALCGQKGYNENAWLWQYRKANKLATVAWGRTKKKHLNEVQRFEDKAFEMLAKVERQVQSMDADRDRSRIESLLNDFTFQIYDETSSAWRALEADYWQFFGMGF